MIAATNDGARPVAVRGVDAIVTTCAFRKRTRPLPDSTPASLSVNSQGAVQEEWVRRVQTLPAVTTAERLYAGRGFGLAAGSAKFAGARFFVLSAGLGLVHASRSVPSYGLTVSSGTEESVANKVIGKFDSAAWFSALLSSPLSDRWSDVVGLGSGRILIALTRPYAEMVGESLSALGSDVLARLRIFGASLASSLPEALHPALVPYDVRLDSILPGTRSDFSQRALHHFVSLVADDGPRDRGADHAAVARAQNEVIAPARPRRPRRTDAEILEMIQRRLETRVGVARILRALRDEEGVACEQSRFSRLYQVALQQRGME